MTPYKFYYFDSGPGSRGVQILPGTNVPYGATEISPDQARQYLQQNPTWQNDIARQAQSFGLNQDQVNQMLSGQQVDSGLSWQKDPISGQMGWISQTAMNQMAQPGNMTPSQISAQGQQFASTQPQQRTLADIASPGSNSGVTGYATPAYRVPAPVTASNPGGYDVYDARGNKLTMDQLQKLPNGNPAVNLDILPIQSAPTGGVTDQIDQYIKSLYDQGYVLNPNVELTPEKVAQFTAQASSEIDPYYQTQLKLAREQLLSSAGYTTDQVNQYETQLEQTYGNQVRSLQSGEAEKGFAQSGERTLQENQLAQNTQASLLQNRQSAQQSLANAGRNYAQQYGGLFGEQVPQGPTISDMPTVSAGNVTFNRTGASSPFYTLSPDVYSGLTGEQEYARRSSELQRTSELEGAYNTQQAIPRTLP
jgi:hypothetical protein